LCLLINIAIIHGRPAENVALRRPLGLPFLESVFDKWRRHVIAKIKETHAALRQPFNERPDIFGERAVKFVSHEGYIKAVFIFKDKINNTLFVVFLLSWCAVFFFHSKNSVFTIFLCHSLVCFSKEAHRISFEFKAFVP